MKKFLIMIGRQLRKAGSWTYWKGFFKFYGSGLYDRSDEHHVFLNASGLAFSIITCIVPLVLIVFWVVGMILNESSITHEINTFIDHVIPYDKYARVVKNIVFSRIKEFTVYRNIAAIFGFLGLLFAASGLFASMRVILNLVFKVKTEESILMSKLRDIRFVLLVLFYFLLSTTILPSIDIIAGVAGKVKFLQMITFGFLTDLIIALGSFLIIFVAFMVIYLFIPSKRPNKRVVFISAFWASILWVLAKELFGFYIAKSVNLKLIYGAYLVVIATVFWIYYSSVVFIIAAEIGQLYRERHGLDNSNEKKE